MAPKDILKTGQTLVVWTDNAVAPLASNNSRQVVRKVGYVVRNGDSLHRMADKFNLRVTDIENVSGGIYSYSE